MHAQQHRNTRNNKKQKQETPNSQPLAPANAQVSLNLTMAAFFSSKFHKGRTNNNIQILLHLHP
eukprot:1587181-Ditylum_brightwellii.AAC.1